MAKRPSVTIPSSSSPQLLDTPTPTKLLEAVDEAGVFQDLAESPFDRDFRKATKKGEEEFLNTPQILPQTPLEKSLIRSQSSSTTTSKPSQASQLKAIAPKDSNAQLILKLPTGPSFFLSNLPFAVKDPLKAVEKTPPVKLSREEDLRERNRFAAIRSRERKKKKIESELAQAAKLREANEVLKKENEDLKRRLEILERDKRATCKFCSSKINDSS